MNRRVTVRAESWPSLIPFRVSNHVWHDFPCIVCEIEQEDAVGRGEGLGVYYRDETVETMAGQLHEASDAIAAGIGREQLFDVLPPGGARFAADSALWDLETQLAGTSAWTLAGVSASPVETVFTIGLEDTPEEMAAGAAAATELSLFKVKLNNDRPIERIEAIRRARPDARLVVDVNEGWNFEELRRFAPKLHDLGVLMIEQPLPRGRDHELEGFQSAAPLCADESCLHLGELDEVVGRYQLINIKLDKTGGLTHGLELAHAALARGLRLMVGSMGGTSLSMAPSHVIAQLCDFVDIDGPLLMGKDRDGGLVYDHGIVSLPDKPFWGQPATVSCS